MKLAKSTIFLIIILILLVLFVILFVFRGNEDNWIKDSRGVYVKHGNPSFTPNYVLEQKDAFTCANDLYNQAKINGIVFDSQCLGGCMNYSVDIVYNPRTLSDDSPNNQCSDYPLKTPYFIELDKNGEIVRVA